MNRSKRAIKGEEEIEGIRKILIKKFEAGKHEKVLEFIISNGGNYRELEKMGYTAFKESLLEF